jgi:putative zinc finger/helix-turn-helix YgiT family protein
LGVEIVARGKRCTSCGEELYDYEELGRQDALIADALVARGVRTGAEFVFVRKSADLKAVDVAELFGVRPETVWRWEHGETEIPRTAAYALGQLYKHPKLMRQSFESLAS